MQWTSISRVVFSVALLLGGAVAPLSGQSSPADRFRVLFPHFAAGNGFSTVFTLMNSGATAADGFLTVHDANGHARTPLQLRIPAQGISSYTIGRPTATHTSGWAEYEGYGGEITGVATFQLTDSNARLVSIAGVLSTQPVQHIRIPAEISFEEGTYSGYAIANPAEAETTVSLTAFDQDGNSLGEISRLTLAPGQQIARFLHQDMPGQDNFAGSLVISTRDTPFIAVALTQTQGLYTAVPAISRPIQ